VKNLLLAAFCLLSGAVLFAQDPALSQGPLTMVGPINYCGSDSGSGSTYACTNTSVSARQIKTLYPGNVYRFKALHANTGASTLSIDGMTAVTIKKMVSGALTDLAAGDIASGQMVDVTYDGTYFQFKPAATTSSFSNVLTGTNTSAAMTVGSGASLGTAGSGTIAATSVTSISGVPSGYPYSNLAGTPILPITISHTFSTARLQPQPATGNPRAREASCATSMAWQSQRMFTKML
jgi:hypothetical protein